MTSSVRGDVGTWPWLTRGLALVVVLAVVMTAAPGAKAQDARVELADGAWRGTMGAAGVLTASDAEGSLIWTGSINGSSLFDVRGGQADGEWSWFGTADLLISTPEGDVPMTLQTIGGGPLSGAGGTLELTGEETTTGSGSFMGITTSVGPNTTPLDVIEVELYDVGCYGVLGDWVSPLNALAAEEGLSGELVGWFVATPAGETMPSPEIAEELEARYRALEQRVIAAIGDGAAGLAAGGLLEVFDLLDEAARLEQEASQLDGTCAYDIAGGPFVSPLSSLLASTLLSMVPAMNAQQLFAATQLLVAAGGAGGAASQAFAAQLESAIAAQAQQLHDVFVTTSGAHPDGRPCSPVDACVIGSQQDVLFLHYTASMLGFTLQADGAPIGFTQIVGALR